MQLNSFIRTIQDFPVPGISFKDITPLLADADALQYAVDRMLEQCEPMRPDVIVSVEARGFLLAAPMAYRLGKPLVPVRKQGKLPYEKFSTSYDLEYGTGTLQIHTDAISDGQRALIVDDLLATGGTVSATAELVRECGGNIAGYAFLIELSFLDGRNKLGGVDVDIVSLITYDS